MTTSVLRAAATAKKAAFTAREMRKERRIAFGMSERRGGDPLQHAAEDGVVNRSERVVVDERK